MKTVFVFGSNLAGIHGKGAALHAVKYSGAVRGIGIGRQGNSYAIPTKDRKLKVLHPDIIDSHVRTFLDYARQNMNETFFITQIGCGLAGYKPGIIAPMFKHAPKNCILPEEWKEYIL